ncbi:MAG: isocitrate/isopropylmalate family dehydrogenase, partial [Actinomycetota bacterium]
APDIAGKGVANPVAAVLSAAHMLEFLGETNAAHVLRAACVEHIRLNRGDRRRNRPSGQSQYLSPRL